MKFAANMMSLKSTVFILGLIVFTHAESPNINIPTNNIYTEEKYSENMVNSMNFSTATTTPKPAQTEAPLLNDIIKDIEDVKIFNNLTDSSTVANTIAADKPSSSTSSTNNNLIANNIYSQEIFTENIQNSLNSTTTTTPAPTKAPILTLENLIKEAFKDIENIPLLSNFEASSTAATMQLDKPLSDHNLFAADLFAIIAEAKPIENIIYSPVSIQTCLALAFIGAEGETAEKMRSILRLGEGDKIEIAKNFGEFLKISLKTENVSHVVPQLKMINRLYVNEPLKLSAEFNKISQKYFNAQAEKVNFSDAKNAVKNINNWVEQQTENKIKNLMSEDAVSGTTNAVLINVIYFKAKWLNPFSLSSTTTSEFFSKQNVTKDIEFMYNEEFFNYIDLPELEASALEMPYEESDLTMLIILPNEIEGLEKLQIKLRAMDLNDITSKMKLRKVQLYLPRFRIEFDIDLKEPLEKMGLSDIFTKNANFKGLFAEPGYQSISDVKHKAFLDVNEAGSEAAAATFSTLTTLSAFFDEPIFRANHPFIFAIRSKSAVYFAGHVATF